MSQLSDIVWSKCTVELTQNSCAKRDRFFLLAVVVESQVPCAGVQILYKHGLVQNHRLNTASLTGRLHYAPFLLSIQTLHIVVLQREKRRNKGNERGWSQVVWQHSYISNSEILWSWAIGMILSNTWWLLKCVCHDWLIHCWDERGFFPPERTSQSGLSVNRKVCAHLCMGRRQPFANVNPEQCILAQGDVELEELRLAEVHQGSPEHPRKHLLGHAPAHLQAARIYAAVASGPWPWDREEGIKQKSISHLGCVANARCS